MRRLLALAAAVALAVIMLPAPAFAHGQLALAEPANQSTLMEPRAQVALYFTEKPASFAFFTVTSPDGVRVDQGWTHGEPKPLEPPVQELNLKDGKWEPVFYRTGFPAMVGVSHWPQKGVYTVQYMTVASDGDKVSGTVRFDYQGAPVAAPAGWQPPVNQPEAALTGGSGNHTAVAQASTPAAQPGSSSSPSPWLIMVPAGLVLAAVVAWRRRRSVGAR
ncbi:copper resistance CopC family protein [Rhizocola hellebori]|nr:copper resistance protein CopC [Rhizocola hellebori]